jgi:hypothetical protein
MAVLQTLNFIEKYFQIQNTLAFLTRHQGQKGGKWLDGIDTSTKEY